MALWADASPLDKLQSALNPHLMQSQRPFSLAGEQNWPLKRVVQVCRKMADFAFLLGTFNPLEGASAHSRL